MQVWKTSTSRHFSKKPPQLHHTTQSLVHKPSTCLEEPLLDNGYQKLTTYMIYLHIYKIIICTIFMETTKPRLDHSKQGKFACSKGIIT